MKYIDAEKLIAEIKKRIKFHDDAMKACTGINTIVITHSAGWKEDTKLLDIIDSLQQEKDIIIINKKDWKAQEQFKKNKDFGKPLKEEQPKKSKKDCNGCPHCVDRKDQYGWHFKGCFGGPYKGKFIAEIDECPLEQEQPEVDLEREAVMFCFDNGFNITPRQAKEIARHFYEFGLIDFQKEHPHSPSNLEEAAEEYADCNSQRWHEDGDVYYDHSKIMDAFKAGAEWSKKDEGQEPEYYQHFDPDC